jgi:hypothetical protein
MVITQGEVDRSLDAAVENGYRVQDYYVDELVSDMMSYDGGLDGADPTELKPLVQNWLTAMAVRSLTCEACGRVADEVDDVFDGSVGLPLREFLQRRGA